MLVKCVYFIKKTMDLVKTAYFGKTADVSKKCGFGKNYRFR